MSQEALLFLLLTPDKDLFNPYDAVKWFKGRLCSAKLTVGLVLELFSNLSVCAKGIDFF